MLDAAGVKVAEALRFFGGGEENCDFGLFWRCLYIILSSADWRPRSLIPNSLIP